MRDGIELVQLRGNLLALREVPARLRGFGRKQLQLRAVEGRMRRSASRPIGLEECIVQRSIDVRL